MFVNIVQVHGNIYNVNKIECKQIVNIKVDKKHKIIVNFFY